MEQIKFLDKFVKVYGFKSISDYTSEISTKNNNSKTLLFNINKNMKEIKTHINGLKRPAGYCLKTRGLVNSSHQNDKTKHALLQRKQL